MDVPLSEDWLKQLYSVLIEIYSNTDDPIKSGFPIVTDYNTAMLNVCVNRPKTKVFGQTMFPHVLHRATVNMHSIINFHPFVDGNKRVALLSTYYYLIWNGYKFNIPYTADEFTIRIARDHLGLTQILEWLKSNTTRNIWTLLRHIACQNNLAPDGTVSASKVFLDETLITLFLPRDGLLFFKNKILEEQRKKAFQKMKPC
jgi:death-on-curing protein